MYLLDYGLDFHMSIVRLLPGSRILSALQSIQTGSAAAVSYSGDGGALFPGVNPHGVLMLTTYM